MGENIGHGEPAGQQGGGGEHRAHSGRPSTPPTKSEILEIITESLVIGHEAGVRIERFTMDGSPCVAFRGCTVKNGILALDK